MKPQSMIIGTGHSVPDRILTNYDLEKIVDTSDEWIIERTGIRERRIKEDYQNTSDFCIDAGQQALAEANLDPEDLDLIMVGTVTGDMRFPATSIFVQAKLGAINATAFDYSAACSGFVYGLTIADQFITTGKMRNALVIGAESMTLMVDWSDRNTCVLFGDGAGAAALVPSDGERGILSTYLGSDGRLAHLLCSPGMGTSSPPSVQMLERGDHYLYMAGREVFLHAVKAMSDSAQKALDRAGLQSEDIDLLIPHQANTRIMDATAKRLGVSKDKVYYNIQKYGNTSSASIPIALNEARQIGRIQPGMKVLMVVFGGGFTWASTVVQF